MSKRASGRASRELGFAGERERHASSFTGPPANTPACPPSRLTCARRGAAVIVVGGGGTPLVVGSQGNRPTRRSSSTLARTRCGPALVPKPQPAGGQLITGVYIFTAELEARNGWDFLRDLVPGANVGGGPVQSEHSSARAARLHGYQSSRPGAGLRDRARLRAHHTGRNRGSISPSWRANPWALCSWAQDRFFNSQRDQDRRARCAHGAFAGNF